MKYLILAAVVGVSSPLFAQSDIVIAKAGDSEIKFEEFKPVFDSLSEADREALSKNPTLLSQTIRTLILQKILLKEATTAGWEKRPEVVAQLARVRDNAIAESYLQSMTKLPEGYPGEADIMAVYEAKKGELLLPKQYKLAQIYVAVPKNADKATEDKAKAKIDSIQKSLKQPGADFSAIAKAQSDEANTAQKGGEIGFLAEASIQPEIKKPVLALAKNGITEPVKLSDGYYIVKLLDVQEPRTATVDEVRDQLIRALRTERLRLNREAALSKIQQQNPVALDEIALSKLIAPPKP